MRASRCMGTVPPPKKRMNLVSSVLLLLLLLLLFRAPLGKLTDSYIPLKGSKHPGEPSKNVANLIPWADVIPCAKRMSTSGKGGLKTIPSLLCKRQEHQLQFWQGTHPARSRMLVIPQGALLVERENDLSTYNWNSFGLRYGKRQAVKAK
ncbi:metastasis-suppressor KiSS-1 [Elgaria multicarinata webbii]|uniref:metastasis-suppressor KiSS-1 n=1 Tax=Elgaria multicarinata webbii TaxID=159646 RepID=UPI002FCD5B2E